MSSKPEAVTILVTGFEVSCSIEDGFLLRERFESCALLYSSSRNVLSRLVCMQHGATGRNHADMLQ